MPATNGRVFMSNTNVAHIQSLYAAFGRGDVAGILAGLTADVDWQTIGRPKDFPTLGARKGTAQAQEFFQLVAENEDFSDFTPREFYAAEDKVFVLGSYSLKLRTNGAPIASEWVHVFTLKNGKVARFREHTDTAQFAEAFAAARDQLALARRLIDEVCNGRQL